MKSPLIKSVKKISSWLNRYEWMLFNRERTRFPIKALLRKIISEGFIIFITSVAYIKACSVKLLQDFKMPLGIPQVFTAFIKWPVRDPVFMVVFADLIQSFPMFQDFAVSLPDTHAGIINMIGFSPAAIKFKNRKIFLQRIVVFRCANAWYC